MSFKLNKNMLLVLAVLLMLVLIPVAFASDDADGSALGVKNHSVMDDVSQPTDYFVVESVEQSAVDENESASDVSDVLEVYHDYENNVISAADAVYVDGFDGFGGSGTSDNPYHSLKDVLNSSDKGNEIYILPGTYDFGNTTVGLYEKDFTLNAIGEVIFTSSQTLFNKYGSESLTMNGIQFKDITSSSSAILYTGSSVNGILNLNNCSFINNRGTNLIDTSYNITVKGCTFINNEATGTDNVDGGLIENIFGSPVINISYSIFIDNKIHYSSNGFNPIIVNGIGNPNPSVFFDYNFVNNNNPLTQDEIMANGGVLNSFSGVNLAVTVPDSASAGDAFDLAVNFTKTDGSALGDLMPNLAVALVPTVNAGSIPVTITGNGGKGQYVAESRDYTENIDVKYGEYVLDTFEFYVSDVGLLNPELTVPSSLIVDIGDTVDINAVRVSDGAVSYVSDDESVVTVDSNGVVTGVGEGIATVTVTIAATGIYGGDTKQVTLMVRDPADANVIYVDGFDESDGGSGIKVDPYHSLLKVLVSENSGKEIRLLPGRYEFTNTIDLKNNVFVLNCAGGDVIFTTSKDYMFKVNDACTVTFNGIKFEDSTVDGSVITRTFSSAVGTLNFNNCDFINNTGDCLIKSSCNVNIKGCAFINNTLTGTGLSNAGLINNYYASTNTIDISYSVFIGNEIYYSNNGVNPIVVDWNNGNGPAVIFKYNFVNDNNAISNNEIAYHARITKGDYAIISATSPSGVSAGRAADLVVNFTKSNGGALDDYMSNLTVSLVPSVNAGSIPVTITSNGGKGQYTAYSYTSFTETVDVKVNGNVITTFQFYVTGVDYISSLSPSVVDEYVIGDNMVISGIAYYNGNKYYAFGNSPMYIYINGNEIKLDNVLARQTDFTFDLADYSDKLVEGINNISVHPQSSALQSIFGTNNFVFNSLSVNAVPKVKPVPEINVTANEVTYGDNVIVNVAGSVAGDYTVTVDGVTKDVAIDAAGESVSVDFGVLAANAEGYAIVASFAETEDYANATNDTEVVVVNKAKVTIDVAADPVIFGSDVIVEITGSADGDYEVNVNGVTKDVSLVAGVAANINFGALDVGTYAITANYTETDNYIGIVNNTEFAVVNPKVDTIISLVYDDNAKELTATLTTADGLGLSRTPVFIDIAGVERKVATNSRGVAKLSTANLNPGNYNVTATYKGNARFNQGNASIDIYATMATVITLVYDDNAMELIATLTTVNGLGLSRTPVFIDIGGVEYKVATNSRGVAKFSVADFTPDIYRATATYKGNDKYNPSNASKTIYVHDKMATVITLVYDDDAKELTATLTNIEGLGLSSTTVNVNVGGVDYAVKTNSRGVGKLSVADLAPGSYVATASYNGNSKFKSTEASINMRIKTDTVISAVYDGDAKELSVTLRTVDGLGLSSTTVHINIDGVDYAVKTNNKGIAKLSISDMDPGSYIASISYNGNSRFSSGNTTIDIEI